MRRLAILTAGGDTPALNATLHGAVQRANLLGIELVGILGGFAGLLDPEVPRVVLNPLLAAIPELDPCHGGTLLGSSRAYLDDSDPGRVRDVVSRIERLGIDGLVAIGGDGTLNGLRPLEELLPCVLAPKTIDNDLGLNSPDEPASWTRPSGEVSDQVDTSTRRLVLEDIVNYATPGYATAVFVVVQAIRRIRTTAESHRRIAIVEVMGRQSGFIAIGGSYGQPDLVVIPECPLELNRFVERVRDIYHHQRHVVIVIGEGISDESGQQLGASSPSVDPAGNVVFRGAAEQLKQRLVESLGDGFFSDTPRHASAEAAIFTRKVGHTQRGGRPIHFDRFHASQLGGQAISLLHEGRANHVATLQRTSPAGFRVDAIPANQLRDRWNVVRPRTVHPDLFDGTDWKVSPLGADYLQAIFTEAVGSGDVEHLRGGLFDAGHLSTGYRSVNVLLDQRTQRGV